MQRTEITVSGPCRGRNISLAMDVIQMAAERGVVIEFNGGEAKEAAELQHAAVTKMTDDTSAVLITVKEVKEEKLTAEELLKKWTDESGPSGWFFRGGAIMGCKPSEKQFLELIERARATA